MTYTGVPILGGRPLPRPSSVSRGTATVRSRVTLAGGGARAYNSGVRKTFELSWARMTETDLLLLEQLVRTLVFTSYQDLDGLTYTVETGDVDADAIAGTDPVRFAVSTTLTQQEAIR